ISDISLADCQLYFGNGNININGQGFIFGENCDVEGGSSGDCQDCSGFGACCRDSGCAVESSSICTAKGGTYQGDCTDCVSDPCPTSGACCVSTVCSIEADEDTCTITLGGIFLGVGTDCSGSPCAIPPVIGACCFDDAQCANTTESGCSGTWFYDAQCLDDPCPPSPGACCDRFTGLCEDDVIANDCLNSGRDFRGEGSTCALTNCLQPIGACCVDLNCIADQTLQECNDLGGAYLGNFTNCIANICLGGVTIDDPYVETSINYKPEDLWIIETTPDQYITRVLYHMQEEIIVSSVQFGQQDGNANNTIDFMFLIDHSGSMREEILQVATAVPNLATSLASRGFDVRFGFAFFGRGAEHGVPTPRINVLCDCGIDAHIADGLQRVTRCQRGIDDELQGSNEDGFTRNVEYLQRAVNCWGIQGGETSPWSAIQFVIEDSQFSWRSGASKFVFFVTDTHDHERCDNCGTFS
ncbi:hypothetical protein LCGC14_2586330, partial [marine sediment metagenome]